MRLYSRILRAMIAGAMRSSTTAILKKAMNTDYKPLGLTLLALIQVVQGANGVYRMLTLPPSELVHVVAHGLIILLALASAFGFLRRRYDLGWIGGNVYAVAVIADVLIYYFSVSSASYVNWSALIYPTILIALLNLRYKSAFERRNA